MEIAPKMDTGPVVSQRRVPIDDAVTAGELEERLAREGASELINVLPGWFDGEMPAKPQDEAQATYCSLLSKRDGLLKSAMTVEAAARAVRAFNPWPGAFVTYAGERLAIWQAHSSGLPDDLVPGTLETRDRLPYLALGNGWLILDEVQRPGGRRVSGEAFINGLRGDLQLAVELGP